MRLHFRDAPLRRAAFRDAPGDEPVGTMGQSRRHVASFAPGNYITTQDGAGFHVYELLHAKPDNGLIWSGGAGSGNKADVEASEAPPLPQAFSGDAARVLAGINAKNKAYFDRMRPLPPKAAPR